MCACLKEREMPLLHKSLYLGLTCQATPEAKRSILSHLKRLERSLSYTDIGNLPVAFATSAHGLLLWAEMRARPRIFSGEDHDGREGYAPGCFLVKAGSVIFVAPQKTPHLGAPRRDFVFPQSPE